MKRYWRMVSGLVAALIVVLPLSASADTLSQTVIIKVRATVLPARYVIVDEQGTIQSIISNTAEDVTPTAYLGSIKPENVIPLTPQIADTYHHIIKGLPSTGPGVLYTSSAAVTVTGHGLQTSDQPLKVLRLLQKKAA